MKKRLLLGTVICSLLVVLFSCSHEIGVGPGTKETVVEAKGSISGTVQYSNAEKDQNGGIMITLDKTDGLNTIAVSKSAASRSIIDSARTVVSSSYTSQDGTYSFSNLEPGTYTVYASSTYSKEKAVYTNAVVKADETTIVNPLNLTATGSISGRITIDGSGWNNIGFLVFVAGTSYMAMTDDSGYYTISDVPAGNYYQIVATKNNVIHFIDSVNVTANQIAYVITYDYKSSELETAIKGEDGKDGKDGKDGEDGKDGAGIVWLGSFASETEILEPKYLNAFFNTTDGCSYIYNGSFWTLLAKAGKDGIDGQNGKDGKSFVWKGERYSAPEDPELNWAYYNKSDRCSYIWNGNKWDLLTVSMHWLGYCVSSDEIENPEYLDAYYNTTDGCSYIWTGAAWQTIARSGEMGYSIAWFGSYASADEIENPEYLWAYYNTTDGCSYIWNGYRWDLLSSSGASIIWKGELNYAPSNPKIYWAYYNINDGCSYIYNGEDWDILSKDGNSINWRGSYYTPDIISNIKYLDVYYNTTDGCTYIYTGSRWELLAKAGAAGINWKGEFASAPSNPEVNWAYYNVNDGCSYIYDGSVWTLLALGGKDGIDGTSIVWLGSYPNAEQFEEPKIMWAYHNTSDGCSYIYTDNGWELLARKGDDGVSGSGDGGIQWLGSYSAATEIQNPVALSAYYNTSDGCSYIYNGTRWILLAKAGKNGLNGTDGTDGISLNWRGSFEDNSYVHDPHYLDIYYNTKENCTYIYVHDYGPYYTWVVLAKGPGSEGTGGHSTSGIVGSETGAIVNGTVLTGWTNPDGVIRIPSGVTDISENALNNCDKITRVIIPSSVVTIGQGAFYDCDGLTSVEFLGNGLETINYEAFRDCENLTNIPLPNSLKVIGANAFYNCRRLTTVVIPDSVESLGVSAYNFCVLLRSITIGKGVQYLNEYTFANCEALVSILIPDTVTQINENLFNGCDSLTTVSISGTWNNGYVLSASYLKKSNFYPTIYTRDTN